MLYLGAFSWLSRLLHRFVSPEELGPWDELVFDTSTLSHAFEGFAHAAVSAYMEMSPPRTWPRLRGRLERRLGSEYLGRRLLIDCDSRRCLVPTGVYRELREVPQFGEPLDILTGAGWRVEQRYVRRRSGRGSPLGFSAVFKPRLEVAEPRRELVDYVMAEAEASGARISREDAEGIALAMERNAVLVTADRRQAELADRLGLRVLYTIGKPVAARRAVRR